MHTHGSGSVRQIAVYSYYPEEDVGELSSLLHVYLRAWGYVEASLETNGAENVYVETRTKEGRSPAFSGFCRSATRV